MGQDDDLAARLRAALAGVRPMREVRMFGGIGFMLNDNLLAAASSRGLLLRVGEDRARDVLQTPGVRPMVMRGRTMRDYVHCDPPPGSDAALKDLLQPALAFVRTLPPKAAAAGRAAKRPTARKGKRK